MRSEYLERGEGHTGSGPGGAVSDCGLPAIHHTLLLQSSLEEAEGGCDLGSPGPWPLTPLAPGPTQMAHTCSVLEILALVASFTCVCRTRPLPDLPRWPRLKPRSSW